MFIASLTCRGAERERERRLLQLGYKGLGTGFQRTVRRLQTQGPASLKCSIGDYQQLSVGECVPRDTSKVVVGSDRVSFEGARANASGSVSDTGVDGDGDDGALRAVVALG